MVLYCFQCSRYVPWVNLPEWRCRICNSVFIDEIPDDRVPHEIIQQVRQERERNIIAQSQQWNQQQPPSTRGLAHGRPMRFPLPPPRTRPQMFVTPDGRIVSTPHHENRPQVPSESEVRRRRNALRLRPYNRQTDGEDGCSVCLDDHSGVVAEIQVCKHIFHQACMERWLEQKNECPLCKTIVAPE